MKTEPFFAFARERYNIFLRRQQNLPKPWTDDEILRQFKFCNVFREDDATTIWIKENIRDPLKDDPFVVPAMMICRWFNRISTLEILKPMLLEKRWDGKEAYELLKNVKPLITAAYLVRSPQGMDKLTGMIWSIDQAITPETLSRASRLKQSGATLESTTEWLSTFVSMGDFLAYEVVSDLRYTSILGEASDIMTWANPGPGAIRGLGRLKYQNAELTISKHEMLNEMKFLLGESAKAENWPSEWPKWEMREAEHCLCEFDKYERTRLGDGTPKQKFDGGGPTTIRYGQYSRTTESAPRVSKDPIEEAVNRKMQKKETELKERLTVFVETVIEDILAKYKKVLDTVPPEFLPMADKVNLPSDLWSGTAVYLKEPRRLPAFITEGQLTVPDKFLSDIKVIQDENLKMSETRAEMYRQISEILS